MPKTTAQTHTPGPWGITIDNNIARIGNQPGIYFAQVNLGQRSSQFRSEKEANARLIAAAPRMYGWLKRMSPSWDEEAKNIIASIEGRE